MIDEELRAAAKRVLDACRARGLRVGGNLFTGGLVAAALDRDRRRVRRRGVSLPFTYADASKQAMLGVPASTLERHGGERRNYSHDSCSQQLAS